MRLLKVILRFLFRFLFVLFLFSIFWVLMYRLFNPPFTPFMLAKYIQNDGSSELTKDWVDLDEINPFLPLAVIAAEDQLFLEHNGFDVEAIKDAIEYNKKNRKTRGASTISQQTAKNVFLIPSRSFLRKGLEVYFTFLIEFLWGKERIMEVYLNVMEQGNNVYGAEASSQKFFGKSASRLSKSQAALMASVLPNPVKFKINSPSNYVLGRRNWIMGQMNNLGGIAIVEAWYDEK